MITFFIAIICLYLAWKVLKRKLCQPNFKNKVVWITGGSSGIGQHLAYEFCRRGVDILIISSRNIQELNRVKRNCCSPDKVVVLKMNMTNFDSVKSTTAKIIQQLESQHKKLDIVVENAGVSMRSNFLDFSFYNHLQLFTTNVDGPVSHIQSFIQHMIKNKSGQVVFMSSVSSLLTIPNRSSYVSSKHAITSIADSLRAQFHQYGLKITTINSRKVKSKIAQNSFENQKGKLYGKKDFNYNQGMETQKMAIQSVKGIFLQQNEIYVSNNPITVGFMIILRGLLPDLCFNIFLSQRQNNNKDTKKTQ